jgi:hypothetical protein
MSPKFLLHTRRRDEFDLSGLALVALLLGALFVSVGVLRQCVALDAFASDYGVRASLSAAQTLSVGSLLLGVSAILHRWNRRRTRRSGH